MNLINSKFCKAAKIDLGVKQASKKLVLKKLTLKLIRTKHAIVSTVKLTFIPKFIYQNDNFNKKTHQHLKRLESHLISQASI